jgi:hypothetical protein
LDGVTTKSCPGPPIFTVVIVAVVGRAEFVDIGVLLNDHFGPEGSGWDDIGPFMVQAGPAADVADGEGEAEGVLSW